MVEESLEANKLRLEQRRDEPRTEAEAQLRQAALDRRYKLLELRERREDRALKRRELELNQGRGLQFTAGQATVTGAALALISGLIGGLIQSAATKDVEAGKNQAMIAIEDLKAKANITLEKQKQDAAERLDREKFETTLILKATEAASRQDQIRNLKFFLNAGFITDAEGKIAKMDEGAYPSSPPPVVDPTSLRLTQSLFAFRDQLATGAPSPVAKHGEGLTRNVFNANNSTDLPGFPVRNEGQASVLDPAANEVYDNLGLVYRFFKDAFGRDSVDNNGKRLVATIHSGQNYVAAVWDGQQLVFGDGDGLNFKRFTAALDVVAARLTEGVTQFTAQLGHQGQPGALNMSISYVFGSMVKQWALGQTVDQADWLIGAEVIGPALKGNALVDVANPGTTYDSPLFLLGEKRPQVGHMVDYDHTKKDNDGIHINSGIPNRAFVLAAKAIGGHSWEKTGKIWYVTLTERLTGNADFAKCATETVSVARDLFPEDPSIAQKVAKAWTDVGVLNVGSTARGVLSGKP
jgi:hypothetical protein